MHTSFSFYILRDLRAIDMLLVLIKATYLLTVVSVAQLVARRTHDREVVGSIPTNAVCFTVVR